MNTDIISPSPQTPPPVLPPVSVQETPQVITSTVNQVGAPLPGTTLAPSPYSVGTGGAGQAAAPIEGASLEYSPTSPAPSVVANTESVNRAATPVPKAKHWYSRGSQESSTHLRKVAVLSGCVVAVILLMIAGLSIYERTAGKRNSDKLVSAINGVNEQDVDAAKLPAKLGEPIPALKVRDGVQTLVVNGDIAIQQRLSFSTGSYMASILAASNFSADQQYLLPDASGTICLDSNNCGYITSGDLQNANASTFFDAGILPVDRGGTGVGTFAPNGIVYGNGTGALSVTATPTAANQCLISLAAGGAPSWGACPGDGGVTAVGSFSGSSQANGASISGTTITFGPADSTNPGMVSTGAQTFAGAKAFSSVAAFTGITNSAGYVQSGSSANTFSGAAAFTAAGTALTVNNNATIGGTLTSGLINGQTVSSSANFTGTLTVQGGLITAGTAAQAGSVAISDGSSSTITFKTATQASATNYDITIPAITANDTICLAAAGNCVVASSLQASYNGGNTILSTDARDIGFTLADTATDSNFTVNIASGSTSKIAFQLNGVDMFRVDSGGVDLLGVDTADFTGATVTFDAGEILNSELQNSQIGVNTGNGLASGGNISLGGSRTLNLGDLTSDWVQGGGYDIVLNNASSELRILESSGGLYYGELDVGDLSATQLYTFPNASGEVSLLGQQIENSELANSSVTINTSTGLSGGGLMSLGGSLTLSVDLGNSIDSSEIVDGVVVPADLNITNTLGAGVNGYIFTYDNTAGKFTLIDGATLNTGGVDTVNGMSGALNVVGNTQVGVSASLGNVNLSLNANSVTAGQLAADSVDASELISTTVGAGSYGSASSVATFTVDADGRLTTAATTAISINTSQISAGTLSVARGGTGAGSFTSNGLLYGNGTGALQVTAAGTGGQVLLADASGVPTFMTLTGDVSVNNTGVTTIGIDAVGSSEVSADSLTASDLAAGSVGTSELLNNTVLAVDLSYTNGTIGAPEDNYILTYDNATGGFTWVDSGTVGTTLTEAQVEDYIFDGDNGSKVLSSGVLALNSLTYTGNLTTANGGTGMTSAGVAGGVYYSTGTAFANTGVGLAGQCLLSNGAGSPSWGNCGGSGALAVTLQVGYDNGNSITTTDARDLTFTLANTATDGNFLVNIATSSTGKAAFQYNGTDLLRIDSAGVDLLGVDTADFTGATVTFDSGEIIETEIAQGTLDDSEIQADSLSAASLAPNSVDASELASTTVAAGSYGSASSVATFTVDADGRLTAAGSTAISINASAISAGILGVTRGGTGVGTFTSNGVLYGNGTGVLQVSAAGTSGQVMIASASGVPTFVTISGDIAVTDTGLTTIQANSVALGTDTTGNYVANNTAGTGIAVSGTSGEAWSPTISLGYLNSLASNSLGSNESTFASTGMIFEGVTADGFETLISLADPTSDNTITLPNASGTFAVSASGNISLSAAGNITITGQIPVNNGGTGQNTFTTGGILLGNGTSGILDSGVLSNGQLLIGDGSGAPTIGTLTQGNGILVTNGAGTIAIAATLGTDIVSGEIVDNTITEADLLVTNAPTNAYVLSYDSVSGGFTWVSGSSFATSEAVVESYIFDGDNTGTLSSGTLALNSISYTGSLTVTNGGTSMTSAGAAGGIYYSTGTAFANTGAGGSGNCLLSNGAGAPSWGSCSGGGTTATLQNVYDNGNSITTTDNRNVSFILADTTTDSDFIVDLQGSGSLFDIQSASVSKLTVDGSTGFIGINDNTPSYQLDVNGTGRFTNDLLVDGNTTLGNTATDLINFTGVANTSLQANSSAGATSRTTEATARTNVTTITITVAGYTNGDVLFINNAGQDYYTRVISGGGTTVLTVDTPVSYDASASVQNYTIQNIGAAASGTSFALANRFFQGYFTGGVVTGAGSTMLSDQNLTSSQALYLNTGGNNTRLYVSSAGNVGIGTVKPLNQFSAGQQTYAVGTACQSNSTTSCAGTTGTSVFGAGTTFTAAMVGGQIIFANGTTSTITALVSATALTVTPTALVANQAYTIYYGGLQTTSGGLVGVGSASPQAMLDVNGQGWFRATTGGALSATSGKGIKLEYNTAGDVGHIQSYDYTGGVAKNLALNSSGGNVGIGTASPTAKLTISEATSTTLTNYTQAVASAGTLITTTQLNTAYTPGLFWNTSDNNPTKPKAGIFLQQDNGAGTTMIFGTSNNYATGITNSALTLSPTGNAVLAGTLTLGGSTLYAPGAASTYGGLTIQGSKGVGNWGGINFKNSSGTNLSTLMTDGTNTGFFNAADSGWNWYFAGSTLAVGTVPAANVSAGTFGAGSYAMTGTLALGGSSISLTNTNTLFYGDGTNTAARGNSFYVQSVGGGSTYAILGSSSSITNSLSIGTSLNVGTSIDANGSNFSTYFTGGEGQELRMTASNGYQMYLENNNGTLRVINHARSAEVLNIAQSGALWSANNISSANWVYAAGAVSAQYLYDSNNGWLADPSGTSTLNNITLVDHLTMNATGGTLTANGGIRMNYGGNGIEVAAGGVYATVGPAGSPSVLCYDGFGRLQACSSSRTLKHDITDLPYGLEQLRLLHPVQFAWNADGRQDAGFIAEDTAPIIPQSTEWNADGTVKSFNYNPVIATLTKSLQELDLEVQTDHARLGAVESGHFGGNITAVGDASIGGNLVVLGTATLKDLVVTGDTTVAQITVERIISKGTTPTAVLGATTGQNGTMSVEGNDTAGTITYTAGTAAPSHVLAAGEQVNLTFTKPYAAQPRVTMTPTSDKAANVRYYVERTISGFKIIFTDAPIAGSTYSFDYQIIQ